MGAWKTLYIVSLEALFVVIHRIYVPSIICLLRNFQLYVKRTLLSKKN